MNGIGSYIGRHVLLSRIVSVVFKGLIFLLSHSRSWDIPRRAKDPVREESENVARGLERVCMNALRIRFGQL